MHKILKDTVYTLRRVNGDAWLKVKCFSFTNNDVGPNMDSQGLPVTGLTEDTVITNAKGNKETVKGTRSEMEEKMGLTKGALAKGTRNEPNKFWVNYSVRIGENDVPIDTSTPEGELDAIFLAAQTQVAFGAKTITPKSEYVLFTYQEEAKQNNDSKKLKRKASAAFEKLTLQDQVEILGLTGVRTNNLSPDVIEDRLSDFMEEYPTKFLAMVEDPTRKHKTFITACLDKGILALEDGAVLYGETVLGYDINSAAIKLFSEEFAKVREAIKTQIEG